MKLYFNRTFSTNVNETKSSLTDNLHADLRRIIFINYSLYLLSMVSMCFSFIFYFSLNKQARREFTWFIGCVCPWLNNINDRHPNRNYSKTRNQKPKGLLYHTRYQHHHPPYNNIQSGTQNNNHRLKTTKFKTHATFVASSSLLANRQNIIKNVNPLQPEIAKILPKRTLFPFGGQI